MKIVQVRNNYYFEFLRIIVMTYEFLTLSMIPTYSALEKYDSHALSQNWNADFFL